MNINIKATGIELTPAIRDYTEKKVLVIEKYFDSNVETTAQVEVGKTTNHHKGGDVFRAEIKINGGGLDLYAFSEKDDLYAAIDLVKDELVRELKHAKGKNSKLFRKQQQAIKDALRGLPNRFKYFRKKD
jgi:putative sigma-54 modulation protein